MKMPQSANGRGNKNGREKVGVWEVFLLSEKQSVGRWAVPVSVFFSAVFALEAFSEEAHGLSVEPVCVREVTYVQDGACFVEEIRSDEEYLV